MLQLRFAPFSPCTRTLSCGLFFRYSSLQSDCTQIKGLVTCHQEFTDAHVLRRVPMASATTSWVPPSPRGWQQRDGRPTGLSVAGRILIKQVSVCSVGFPDVCGTDRASHGVY
ncbi:hypothetical protein AAFF_G00341890 [Aldrovandia affinis]|uniref:Uncharacterized protein n=1 Tax=Aldrovandia affinis TaxID=143900 RepID=A0AAD7SKR5_9TELE|nr:hypothetical protein AAFF_G00341890 [Aldrovandia affinis]